MLSGTGVEAGRKPIKLALLICDTPIPAVLERRGTYLDIFRDQLRFSNPRAEFPFELDGYDVVTAQEYPELDNGYTGILISGSAASAYEDKPWILKLVSWVEDTVKNRPDIKLIGICFGHQIIARALGGECVPNGQGWEVGTTDVQLTSVGKEVFGEDGPSISIQQMHRDRVPSVPPSFYLLGSTDICPIQGMVKPYVDTKPVSDPTNIHILTVQGHPEFNAEIVNLIIDARECNGAMNAEIVKRGRESAVKPHEGIGKIGRAIWRVLGVDAVA